jgi:uncharacterized protein involved in response to NO
MRDSTLSIPSRRRGRFALIESPFRPFFLVGAAWAALAMAAWLAVWRAGIDWPSAMAPRAWHAHEMLFGYVSGVAAGFLLTAVPKWTGRPALTGLPLILVLGLWVAGRLALAVPSAVGTAASAAIDLAFLPAVGAIALADIVAARRWRDWPVLVAVGILLLGNVVFHLDAAGCRPTDLGVRIGLAGTVIMMVVVGGRAVPGYTRMLLLQRDLIGGSAGPLPRPFSRVDLLSIGAAAAALAAWIVHPLSPITGALLLVAGAAHLVRGARWAFRRTLDNRILLILHLGYGFIAVGFLLAGAASCWPAIAPADAGVHAWATGAIGLMTLGVMSHLVLRHDEGRLVVSATTELMCAAAASAAAVRVCAAIVADEMLTLTAGALWIAAFACFAAEHGLRLIRARRSLKDQA